MIPYLLMTMLSSNYVTIENDRLSTPGETIVEISEEVDIENSKFFYQGKQMDVKSNRFSLLVDQENENIFQFLCKDENGNILADDRKVIILDTCSPIIQVTTDETIVEDTLFLTKKTNLMVSITDSNLESVEIYVDDVLVEKSANAMISILEDNKHILIKAKDQFDHETIKEIKIVNASMPAIQLDFEEFSYISNPTLTLRLSDICKIPVDLIVYTDGVQTHRIPCLNQKELEIVLKKEGDISLKLVHSLNPKLVYPIQNSNLFTFYFSDKRPQIKINSDTYQSNQDIVVSTQISSRYLKDAYIEVNDGKLTTKYPINQDIVLKAVKDKHIVYHLKVFAEDMFSQTQVKEMDYIVDNKGVDFALMNQDETIPCNTIYEVDKQDVIRIDCKEEAKIETTILKNGIHLKNVSLNQAIQGLGSNDLLEVTYRIFDTLQNENVYSYALQLKKQIMLPLIPENEVNPIPVVQENKEPIKKPLFSKDQFKTEWNFKGIKENEEKSIQYIWQVENQDRLVVKDIIKEDKEKNPDIQLIKEDDESLRVVLMTNDTDIEQSFESIEVNGNTVDFKNLKRDKLNQPYYQFKPKDKNVRVKAITKDDKGNKKIVEKELNLKKESSFKPYLMLLSPFLLYFLARLIKRLKHGKTVLD